MNGRSAMLLGDAGLTSAGLITIFRFLATFVAALHLVVSTAGIAMHVGLEGSCCGHAAVTSDEPSTDTCSKGSHGCCCHASQQDIAKSYADQTEQQSEGPAEHSDHDCSDCVVCQQLAQASRANDSLPLLVVTKAVALESAVQPTVVCLDVWAPESPRGPPV